MLPSTSPREALLACHPFLLGICLPSLWSPPLPLHTLAKVRLSLTLTFSSLTIWFSGQTALFLFLLARAAPAYFPTALSVALRPLFPFQQAHFVQVFLLKPASFCTLFAGLSSTNKSVISLLFSYLTLVLFSPSCPLLHLSFYLNLSGKYLRNCLFFPLVLSGYNGSPNTRFSRGTTRLMSWPDGERFLRSRTGGVLSHLNSSTHRLLDFNRETCAPSSRSLCFFSSTLQQTQPTVKFLSF